MTLPVEVGILLRPGALRPHYTTPGAAGADIRAYLPNDGSYIFAPGERAAIPTGVFIALPPNYEAQVRPRSGLAFSAGLTVLNAPGTIDSDYRGEIKVILINTSRDMVKIQHGDRIAQLVIAPVVQGDFQIRSELSDTLRGSGGFGSTGTA